MLLQIMEDGHLTDSFGRHIDFKNVIMIMTSNIGADLIKNQTALGFKKVSFDTSYESMKEMLIKEVQHHFRPEFLNRLDEIIVFRALTKEDLRKVVEIEIKEVKERLKDRNLTISLDESAIEFLIKHGYNPDFGARPLKRAIEKYVEDPLSEQILKGAYAEYNHIKIGVKDDHLYFEPCRINDKSEPARQSGGSVVPSASDSA